ncbi:hypothetical protein GOZ83_05320 [Agrobacterium vitis]|uniref:hypothetical protein n=1 Tax=Rhizobium/Agrobacterium group TaxID=227290 RepID=UPI0012E7025B|nr:MULTISPECIES: hypothetical protein [Rhizobium/Agrobacterium group]MCF1492510.1 hypothetical protein [Allorhizobium ampelinum]MVA44502.1 hypothetical protein [Agrobacterium vitis]
MKTLQTDIIIALRTLARPMKNQLAGLGVSRKREPVAAMMVAEHIARSITRNHRFIQEGNAVSAKMVETFLTSALTDTPDTLIRAFGSKSQLESDPAGDEISHRLTDQLKATWDITYVERDTSPGPSTY